MSEENKRNLIIQEAKDNFKIFWEEELKNYFDVEDDEEYLDSLKRSFEKVFVYGYMAGNENKNSTVQLMKAVMVFLINKFEVLTKEDRQKEFEPYVEMMREFLFKNDMILPIETMKEFISPEAIERIKEKQKDIEAMIGTIEKE